MAILVLANPALGAGAANSPNAVETNQGVQRLSALSDTMETMDRFLSTLSQKEAALKAADAEEEKAALKAEIVQIKASLEKWRKEFEIIVWGGRAGDRRTGIGSSLRSQVRNPGDRPPPDRSIEKRHQMATGIRGSPATDRQLREISPEDPGRRRERRRVVGGGRSPKIKQQLLADARTWWGEKEKEIQREINFLRYQLDQKTALKQSVVKDYPGIARPLPRNPRAPSVSDLPGLCRDLFRPAASQLADVQIQGRQSTGDALLLQPHPAGSLSGAHDSGRHGRRLAAALQFRRLDDPEHHADRAGGRRLGGAARAV